MKKSIEERKKKIDSPYAKYNNLGQITCTVCGTVVKTEVLWPVHCKNKTHIENLTQQQATKSKANAPPPAAASNTTKRRREDEDNDDTPLSKKPTSDALPSGFFDAYEAKADGQEDENDTQPPVAPLPTDITPPKEEPQGMSTDSLPEGFFDDARVDAKVRGQKPPDKAKEVLLNKEFAKFQESISEDINNGGKIKVDELLKEQGEDLEEETVEDNDFSEEQEKTQKMLDLKKKAAEIQQLKQKVATKSSHIETDAKDLIDPDEFFDWRAKGSMLDVL